MNTSGRLRSMTCVGPPLVGFALICAGVFQMFLGSGGRYVRLRVVMGYVEVMVGFLLMLIGVIWAICHSGESGDPGRGDVRAERPSQLVCTVDR